MQLAGFLMDEEGHRHTPLALTRQRPVRAIGDHAMQTCLAPCREEIGFFDAFQCGFAQALAAVSRRLIHAGKPLRGSTIDDRCLMTPAVHIAVVKHDQLKQRADFFQLGADRFGGFPDGQAGKQRQP